VDELHEKEKSTVGGVRLLQRVRQGPGLLGVPCRGVQSGKNREWKGEGEGGFFGLRGVRKLITAIKLERGD